MGGGEGEKCRSAGGTCANKLVVIHYKMKNITLISIIFLSWSQLFSQDYPTKRELNKLFSEKQEYFGKLNWETCNDDSAYYKNDTIKLYYRNTTCLKKERCCERIDWTFFKGKSFGISNISLCQKTPSFTAIGPDDRYKINIKKADTFIQLHIKDSKNEIEIFEVISMIKCMGEFMAYGKYGYELILKRKKLKNASQ